MIYFDLCAIPVFLIILLTTFIRKTTNGIANKLFISLVVISLLATVSDVLMLFFTGHLPLTGSDVVLGSLFSYSYKVLRNGTIVVYLFFIFAITRTLYKLRHPLTKLLIIAPYAALLVVLFLNLFFENVFTITQDKGYARGSLIIVLYVISLAYALVGTGYLIFCKRFLEFKKWIALISMYILSFAAIFIQFIYPDYLVEMFSTALAFLMIILLVLRPEEITDHKTGLASYMSYQSELYKVLKTKQQAQVFMTRFVNAGDVLSYLGEDNYYAYIVRIANHLSQICRNERLSYEMFFENPGGIYILVDNTDYNIKSSVTALYDQIRQRALDSENTVVELVPKICSLQIPEDMNDFENILHFGHCFHELMPYDKVFSRVSTIMKSDNFKIEINMDTILNRAITENLFEMYYQPIYSISQKKFISAEALIRLKDREFGFIPPGLFIPAAESRGLMLPIGDFVLEDVHRFISEHNLSRLGISYIEVNLSVVQCLQRNLPDKIKALQSKYNVPANKINLEITETTYANIGDVMSDNLRELSSRGYTFSLDDYGTGYSNIHRISKLPLNIIKIDKTLVDSMDTPSGKSIMENTVRMMKDIHKEIVVEGVETEERLHEFERMGCDFIQGYYFSKPLPEDEFVKFIIKNNP